MSSQLWRYWLSAILLGSSFTVFALTNNNPLPISNVLEQLQKAGYSNVQKIEYEHGVYKVEMLNDQGYKTKLRMDATTGTILKPVTTTKNITNLQQIVKNLQNAGYRNIRKIEMEQGQYKVTAYDNQGQKIKLKVNAATGNIDSRKHDDD
jgi:uncharacterized membrane protein YkoI